MLPLFVSLEAVLTLVSLQICRFAHVVITTAANDIQLCIYLFCLLWICFLLIYCYVIYTWYHYKNNFHITDCKKRLKSFQSIVCNIVYNAIRSTHTVRWHDRAAGKPSAIALLSVIIVSLSCADLIMIASLVYRASTTRNFQRLPWYWRGTGTNQYSTSTSQPSTSGLLIVWLAIYVAREAV